MVSKTYTERRSRDRELVFKPVHCRITSVVAGDIELSIKSVYCLTSNVEAETKFSVFNTITALHRT